MPVLSSLAAVLFAQFLPGLLIVEYLGLGRYREERWVLAGVLSSPVAALLYLTVLVADWPALYWILLAALDGAAILLWRRRAPLPGWKRETQIWLFVVIAAIAAAYLSTTGSFYREDAEGSLMVDRALQRDVLFHIGIVRSLESSYPPSLLSVSGVPVGYHVGYHLQIAAWARFFGVDVVDGLVRVAPLWFLALLVASAYVLGRRVLSEERRARLVALLVLCSGFGFVFFSRPSLGWWSLAFMDVTLVSIFLTNPLLPALPLLFVSLSLLDEYLSSGAHGPLFAGALAVGFLLIVKMFAGAQVLAGLGMHALVDWKNGRIRLALFVVSLLSLPAVVHTFFAAGASNTSVGIRPLEIVRYSMEKLDLPGAAASLAEVGELDASLSTILVSVLIGLLWLVGFLGARSLGLLEWARDLVRPGTIRTTMAWFVAIGFPVALVFRIAPAEATGLSRLEAQNDVVWFAAQSGLLLWFWTASVLARWPRFVMAPVVACLALPATVQHFVHASRIEPDRVGASRLEAARRAKELSSPAGVWVDPPDRARPSLLPYFAGRSVVHDGYVGYDYMFVGREETELRRHAVAQFFASQDPGYRAWFLEHFGVEFLWQETAVAPARGTEPIFRNADVTLYRVVEIAKGWPIVTPDAIAMGGRGTPFFGPGWVRAGPTRRLEPGSSKLYLPRERGERLRIEVRHLGSPNAGTLEISGGSEAIAREPAGVTFDLAPWNERGLHAIDVKWAGGAPLVVTTLGLVAK